MAVNSKLAELLEQRAIPYEIISHPRRYTALETAEAEHIAGHTVAKAVMVRVDGKDSMFVIPADSRLDFFKVQYALGAKEVEIEEEREFESLFPDCEKDAMPPVGSLYRIPCYVDAALVANKMIVFNAGTHEASIKMAMKDYLLIAEAEIGDFAVPRSTRSR